MTAAQKAAATRARRNQFRSHFGDDSYATVAVLTNGLSPTETAQALGFPVTSVRATAANLTRGAYDRYLDVQNGSRRL